MKYSIPIVILGAILVGGLVGTIVGGSSAEPELRNIDIRARQYAYDPAVINANVGDTLRIRLMSLDVIHGFYLEGHDLDSEILPNQRSFHIKKPSIDTEWREVESVDVVLKRGGKYRYRCSHTCGTMHPFMLGELLVAPNTPFHAGVGGVVGLFIAMLVLFSPGPFLTIITGSAKESDDKV
jgi:heme/copper-type cytochrome/quinol oxidase subunit 2